MPGNAVRPAHSARRHFPAGSLADGDLAVRLTPADAGWTWCGLEVRRLQPGSAQRYVTDGVEAIVLPLSALDVEVVAGDQRFTLAGRTSPFARVSDFCDVGPGTELTLHSPTGGEVAICTAVASNPRPARYGPAESVAVELRGAGPATRQVNNFASPEAWPHAERIMCVELLTPDGNWSSYPPHRHDDSPECPVNNEEIYYFRIGRAGSTECDPEGFGLHRTYTPDGDIDDNLVVRDGDVYVVPRGYHGPCVAAPGYPMYYLNVLAGPGGDRSMAFCDDPTHHWVRDSWAGMALDARCPMTSASGPRP